MKGGAAMNQQEFEKKIKESEEIRAGAMRMAEEANELMDTDRRLSNEMFIESMEIWCRGCEMAQQAIDEAFASGIMEVSEGERERLSQLHALVQSRMADTQKRNGGEESDY